MSKHTNWSVEVRGNYYCVVTDDGRTVMSTLRSHSTDKREDAHILASERGKLELEEAHLIASAPAMLDALRECLAVLEDDQGIYDDDPDWWGRRSDAIDKARNALPRGTP